MSTHDFAPNSLPRLGVLIAAALLLHAVILGGADWVWPSNAPPPLPAATLQVRVLAPLAPAAATESVTMAAEPRPEARVAPAKPPAKTIVAVKRAVGSAPPAVERVNEPAVTTPVRLAEAPPIAVPAGSARADFTADITGDEPIPLYRTRLLSATTLRYEVSHGALHGTGEVVWRPQADRYDLNLEFKLGGLTILSQASTGSIDAAGIAPLRFTDRRPRRGTTAANFQRRSDESSDKNHDKATDKITYSGSQSVFALAPGAQDRLSWMLQLAAIVAAGPQLGVPGARVVMQVTGSRGDAGAWVFRCMGAEPVDTRSGPIDALKFVREAREAYDSTVQVWLDPKQQHLPVRATQKSGGSDEGYELRLVEATAPN